MPKHLTAKERDHLARLRHQGASQREIASVLKRSPATISRELKRNRTDGEYLSGQAQRQAERRRRERPLKRKMEHAKINDFVRQGLIRNWSPEQIAGRLKQQHPTAAEQRVSAQTIYTWIDQDPRAEHWRSHLRRRGKRPNRRKNQPVASGAPIANRPAVIEKRARLGDFEGDTVLGPPGTGGLATLVDRQARYTIVTKVSSKQADHVHARIKPRMKNLDETQRHSITFDNGTEFARCHRLERHLEISLYFADPGCPYQRGTNENTNGLIRQYFPKGTDFRNISHARVRHVEDLLNNRPRACLGFRTPTEVFFKKNPPAGCD